MLPTRISRLVIMGGAWQARGNQTPAAEFNFAADPESAYAVFERFHDITLLPWEVALDQMMPLEVFERIRAGQSARARFFAAMTRIAYDWRDRFGFAGVPLPDPLAMVVALEASTITHALRARVLIDIGHSVGRGLSALDYYHPQPNARVVTAVDAQRAWEMVAAAWA
jgi:purine nucleosidase